MRIRARLDASTQENGYGFIAGERGGQLYIVTANHVVRSDAPGASTSSVEVMFFSDQGKWHPAELLERVLDTKDVAVLRVRRPEGLMWKANSLAVEKKPLSGRQVWFIGRPDVGDEWYVTFTPGIISQEPNTNDELTVETSIVRAGMSGAPILTETGITGMVIRDKDAAIATALHTDPIREAFAQWQYPWDLSQSDAASTSRATAQPLANSSMPKTPESSSNNFKINATVRADNTSNGWTNTGLVVIAGQRLSITSSGSVTIGNNRTSTPSGLASIADPSKLMRNEPTGGLIAVIGDDNDEFIFIGSGRDFVAARSGVLFLGVNEGYLDDNIGSYSATIYVQLIASKYVAISVPAKNSTNGWTTSGLVVQRGQRLKISAYGRISLGPRPDFTCPPGGLPSLIDNNKLMRNEPTGGLIAVIGDDNDEFIFIGSGRDFVAARTGVLFLGVNEGNPNDSAGAFSAIIEYDKIP